MANNKIDLSILKYDCDEHEVFIYSEETEERYDEGYSADLTETMHNILNNKIIDYMANQTFDEAGLNFCEIGQYSDMPGQEEVEKVVSTIPKECWEQFLEENPQYNDSDALKFIDEDYKAPIELPIIEEKIEEKSIKEKIPEEFQKYIIPEDKVITQASKRESVLDTPQFKEVFEKAEAQKKKPKKPKDDNRINELGERNHEVQR